MKNTNIKKYTLSIVTPVMNEYENLQKLYDELNSILEKLEVEWEIIFVDDGSNDHSWDKIEELSHNDSRIQGLRFSRNYGHQYALFAGLRQAKGDAVITMDADLQHPPDVIPQLIEEWKNGKKIVRTVRREPPDISLFKKWTSKLFYKIFSFLSGIHLESGMADFRLLDRLVVEEVLHFREQGLFLRGIIQFVGYPKATVDYQCRERYKGSTKYTLLKMLRFAWIGIRSFSIVPLRTAIFFGIITSLFAFYQIGMAFYAKAFTNETVPGWTSLMCVMSLMFGMLFILLGIIGEYIGRILIEVRDRPRYIIREKTRIENE